MKNISNNVLIPRKSEEEIQKALSLLGSIESLTVTSQAEYNEAAAWVRRLKGTYKNLESERTTLVKPLSQKVAYINEKFKLVTSKIKNGCDKINLGMTAWYTEAERKRKATQAALALEAESKRQKAEESAIKVRSKADAYREEGRFEMAEKADMKAEAKLEEASTIVAREIEQLKTKGISYRTDYSIIIIDRAKAIRGLVSNPLTNPLIMIDTVGLVRLIKSVKGNITLEGIDIIEKERQVVRS